MALAQVRFKNHFLSLIVCKVHTQSVPRERSNPQHVAGMREPRLLMFPTSLRCQPSLTPRRETGITIPSGLRPRAGDDWHFRLVPGSSPTGLQIPVGKLGRNHGDMTISTVYILHIHS